MRSLALFTTLPLMAGLLPAQNTILVTTATSGGEHTLAIDMPEVDTVHPDGIHSVTPMVGVPYTARPFLPISLQWHYVGDLDNDGQYVEGSTDGPMGSSAIIDEIFVKAGTVGPVSPRDVFFSISAANATFGVAASDVVRYAAQGVREVFVTELQLEIATGGTSLNLDALCQSAAGDLFLSFSLTETLHFGSAEDGDLLFIPASAITYDANGNVLALLPNSVTRIATEAQVVAMRTASGFREFDGTTPTTLFELGGLEIDPNGGTWVSQVDAQVYPNLLFAWSDTSNDGAILSTANGGSIATINGVPMASATATTGTQIGWYPGTTGTGGIGGLAVIPQQPHQFQVLNYPRNLHTQGDGQTFVQLQTSGGAPNGITIIAWSVESAVPGGSFLSIPAVPPFVGEFGITSPIIIGAFLNDALGNTATGLMVLDTAMMSGANVAAQAVDFPSFQLSTPSAMSFL